MKLSALLRCLPVLLGLPVAGAPPPDSVVLDGDFEAPNLQIAPHTAPDRWTAFIHGDPSDAVLAIVAGAGRNGSRGVRYSKTDAGNQNIHLDQILTVTPASFYEVRAWMRTEGKLNPVLSVMAMDWSVLATASVKGGGDWTEVRLLFPTGSCEQVRLEWFPGAEGKLYTGVAGTSFLDDVSVVRLDTVPEPLRRAFALQRPEGREMDIAHIATKPVGAPLPLRPIQCRDGVLVYADGGEVALWGANLQTALSWEYLGRMRHCGIPLEAAALKEIADRNVAELKELGTGIVRLHLLPADFTDGDGTIRDSVYLDVLDYTIYRCSQAGIYVYLTLLNEMNTKHFPDSFLVGSEREEWLLDEDLVGKTEHYVQSFLTRANRYSGLRYADDPALAIIELINEPGYADYDELCSNPRLASVKQRFEQWLGERGLADYPDVQYTTFRYEQVGAYLARLCAAVRGTGARQPIAWNLNWPRFVRDHEDVYQAVAESPVDVVSFCLYPGQGDVPRPYWDHPRDLGGKNYLPYVRDVTHDYAKLRWLLGERFAGKAKAVYEFETFFNQSSYLYPAMAAGFRSLGAQVAHMWTYTLTPTAERFSGSHYLNLYCTPAKAASFAIAAETFARIPRYTPYPPEVTDPLRVGPCLVSFAQDLSVLSTPDLLMYSHSFAAGTVSLPDQPSRLLGRGDSPLVAYAGTGIYHLEIGPDAVDLTINPDAEFVLPHWDRKAGGPPWSPVCVLDSQATHPFTLRLPGWSRVWRMEGETRQPVAVTNTPDLTFSVSAGHYRIERAAP